MPKDYYAILGIEKSASDAEIKLAFRNKAKHLHPDVNQSQAANSQFQELNEAYSILSNPSTRNQYDQGENEAPHVTYTWEDVEQILREREQKREQAWRQDFGYPGEKIYPPTNYKANERTVQFINLAMLLFAFTFIIDFFVFLDVGSEQIISQSTVIRKFKRGGRSEAWVEFKTKSTIFYISYAKPRPQVGDQVDLKRSLFYGNHKVKTSSANSFERADDLPMVTYIIAVLTFIIAWLGTTKYFNAEQKFNAAIISCFFCIAMIVILFYPK